MNTQTTPPLSIIREESSHSNSGKKSGLWSKLKKVFRIKKSHSSEGSKSDQNSVSDNTVHSVNKTKITQNGITKEDFKIIRPVLPTYKIMPKDQSEYVWLQKHQEKTIPIGMRKQVDLVKSMTSSTKTNDHLMTTIWTEETIGEINHHGLSIHGGSDFLPHDAIPWNLFMLRNNFYKEWEYEYPWLDIHTFCIAGNQKSNPNKSIIGDRFPKLQASKRDGQKLQTSRSTNLKGHQHYIYIKKKPFQNGHKSAFGFDVKSQSKVMIYFHDHGADIGSVLGHCIDLSSQLGCDVLIPEFSGFGGYNSKLRKTLNKKILLSHWIIDAKNACETAKKITKSKDYKDMIIYSKGMSTSIVMKLMKTEKFKNIIFENSLYTKHRSNLLINTTKTIKKADLPKYKLETSVISSDSICSLERTESDLPEEVPRFLFIESNTFRQHVHSNDIITSLISKIHNVKNLNAVDRINTLTDSYSRSIMEKGNHTTDNLYSGCIRHIAFECTSNTDFKREHRRQFISALRWIIN